MMWVVIDIRTGIYNLKVLAEASPFSMFMTKWEFFVTKHLLEAILKSFSCENYFSQMSGEYWDFMSKSTYFASTKSQASLHHDANNTSF